MSNSVKEIRRIETEYINSGAVTSSDLMYKAASGVYRVLMKYSDQDTFPIILTGKGNNGGDGYALGCILIENEVPHALISIEEPKSSDSIFYRNKYIELSKKSNLPPIFDGFYDNFEKIIKNNSNNLMIIDCMLGTGIKGALHKPYSEIVSEINRLNAFIIACDMPSGLTDNGLTALAIKANVTVAIGGEKDAYYLNDCKDYCGIIECVDIGLPIQDAHDIVDIDLVRALFPIRRNNTHKGTYGTALLIGCSDEYVGAGELAAMSAINTMGLTALRSGAGLTRLIVPDRMLAQMWSKVRDCSLGMKSKLRDYKVSAYGYGMGVGTNDIKTLEYLLLETAETPLLIDADGLNILSQNIDLLSNIPENKPIIITPHVKEMSRLSNISVNDILADPITCAEDFAKKNSITVLLKGVGTVITNGDKTYINVHGSPCLAKGGSGDVLSGIITALMARGIDPLEAGAAACFILGEASLIAESQYGTYSTTPTDVAKAIKKITRIKE